MVSKLVCTIYFLCFVPLKSRKENPQKLTQLSSRSYPRHLVEKRTAQKDTIIDITSDSQVNSNFPYRWSSASLTFNNYFYLFLYLYITFLCSISFTVNCFHNTECGRIHIPKSQWTHIAKTTLSQRQFNVFMLDKPR